MLALSGAFLASFARAFLELPSIAPRADRAARAVRNTMAILAGGSLLLSWTGHAHLLVYGLLASALTPLVLFMVAIAAWRAGARQARYFILAFGMLLAGLAPTLPIWIYNNLFRPNQAPVVNVVAVVLVLVSILPVWLAQRLSGGDAAGVPDAAP